MKFRRFILYWSVNLLTSFINYKIVFMHRDTVSYIVAIYSMPVYFLLIASRHGMSIQILCDKLRWLSFDE